MTLKKYFEIIKERERLQSIYRFLHCTFKRWMDASRRISLSHFEGNIQRSEHRRNFLANREVRGS